MHTKSTLRATARPFYPRSHTNTPTDTNTTSPTTDTHSGPPTPYITAVEPYQAHPVSYVQIGPHQHVPLYIYHQVRGIYIGTHFHPQQEQYFYSHVPPPPQPVSPVQGWGNEWEGDGHGAWVEDRGMGDGYSGFMNGGGYHGGYGYEEKGYGGGYGGQARGFKNGGGKQGFGKKGGKYKKNWGHRGKKKGERLGDDQVTLVGRDSAVFG